MDIIEAKKIAYLELEKHNLLDWNVLFNKICKRIAGRCVYKTKTIELSYHMVKVNNEDLVRDVILHEIAHAIVGSRAGHSKIWKQKCQEIGCSGKRSENGGIRPKGKYTIICPTCLKTTEHYRKTSKYIQKLSITYCDKCGIEKSLGKLLLVTNY